MKEKVLQLIRSMQSDLIQSRGEQLLYQELNKLGSRIEVLDTLRQLKHELNATADNMITIAVIQTIQDRY